MGKIDPLYYVHSSRIDLKDETRINVTSEEATEWEKQNQSFGPFFSSSTTPVYSIRPSAPPPNFISEIFYLTLAMSHYGYLRTIQTFNDLGKHTYELQRHLDRLNGDNSWMGVR